MLNKKKFVQKREEDKERGARDAVRLDRIKQKIAESADVGGAEVDEEDEEDI